MIRMAYRTVWAGDNDGISDLTVQQQCDDFAQPHRPHVAKILSWLCVTLQMKVTLIGTDRSMAFDFILKALNHLVRPLKRLQPI